VKKPAVEPIPPERILGESDWDDEDLLTIDEATARLDEEIKSARRRVEQADTSSAPAERARLEALIRAAERIRAAQANAPR
jgi:hypothetical protein